MNKKVLIYLIPMALAWGSAAGSVLMALARLPVVMVVLLNLGTGLVFLTVYLALTGGFRTLAACSRPQWLRLACLGVIGSFLYYTLYYYGLKTAGTDSAIEVCMMNYLFPITTVIFSAFILRERLTAIGGLSIFISFSGAYVILTGGRVFDLHVHAWQIMLLGLGGAILWGLFGTLGRKWTAGPTSAMFVYYLTSVALNVVWLVLVPSQFVLPTWREFAWMAYAGIVCNCIGTILWFKALQVSSATLVGNVSYASAFLNVLVIHLLTSAPVRVASLIGLGLISVGVLLAGRYGHRMGEHTHVAAEAPQSA